MQCLQFAPFVDSKVVLSVWHQRVLLERFLLCVFKIGNGFLYISNKNEVSRKHYLLGFLTGELGIKLHVSPLLSGANLTLRSIKKFTAFT